MALIIDDHAISAVRNMVTFEKHGMLLYVIDRFLTKHHASTNKHVYAHVYVCICHMLRACVRIHSSVIVKVP